MHRTPRCGRERRNDTLQERAKPTLNTFGQTMGSGQEGRDVLAEFTPDTQVPATPFGGRRHPHVPRSHEMTQRLLHGLPDSHDRRRVGGASNLDGNRVDDEHRPREMQARHRQKPLCCLEKGPDLDDKSPTNCPGGAP
jgi:hypothetical protein